MNLFKKQYNLKIAKLLIVLLFIFNNTIYGMDLPKRNCLRVPLKYDGQVVQENTDTRLKLKEALILLNKENGKEVVKLSEKYKDKPTLDNLADKVLSTQKAKDKLNLSDRDLEELQADIRDSLKLSIPNKVIELKWGVNKARLAAVIELFLSEANIAMVSVDEPGDLIKQLKKELKSTGSYFDGLDDVILPNISHAVLDTNSNIKWYLFKVKNTKKYVELFVKDGKVFGYGIITIMPGDHFALRFHVFNKDGGNGELWAKSYAERVYQIDRYFKQENIPIQRMGAPTDQILSEDQLGKRIRHYCNKFFKTNADTKMKEFYMPILNKIRYGIPLDAKEIEIVTYKGFSEYHSFGLAANFYMNKLGDFMNVYFADNPVVLLNAIQKDSEKEGVLLRKLQNNEKLTEEDLIYLFSGRSVILSLRDNSHHSGATDTNSSI